MTKPRLRMETIFEKGPNRIIACRDHKTLSGLADYIDRLEKVPNPEDPQRPIILFDEQTIWRWVIRSGTLVFQEPTACLLRIAHLWDRALTRHFYENFRNEFFDVVKMLIEIGDEVARRTQGPYYISISKSPWFPQYPKLDSKVLEISPLPRYPYWRSLLNLRTGRSRAPKPRRIAETLHEPVDAARLEKSMAQVIANLRRMRAPPEMGREQQVNSKRTIKGHLGSLGQLTYGDIEHQTRARFLPGYENLPVAKHVGLVIYNSVYSVTLDPQGDPIALPGINPYCLLLAKPGARARLIIHMQPPGLYLSVAKTVGFQFAISGSKTRILPFSGSVGFEAEQESETWVHPIQDDLTKYMEWLRTKGTPALVVITVDEALKSRKFTLARLEETLPWLLHGMMGYAVDEIRARLKELYSNYHEILTGLYDVILDELKDWARDWVMEKTVKKILPIAGPVSTIIDLFDKEEQEVTHATIACVLLATKGRRPDDLTIAAKILAKIATKKIEDEILGKLVTTAAGRGIKLVRKPIQKVTKYMAPKMKPLATDEKPPDSPSSPTEPMPEMEPPLKTNAPTPAPGNGRRVYSAPAMPKRREIGDRGVEGKRTATEDVEAARRRAIDGPGTAGSPGVGQPETVQLRPGVYRRRGRKPPTSTRTQRRPEAMGNDGRDEDIETTRRELTRPGSFDDRGTDPDVHPSQSHPESIQAARQAGVPDEVIESGYVVTRNDFPDAAPDRPIPKGKRAPPRKPAMGRTVGKSEIQNREVLADLLLTEKALQDVEATVVDVRVNQTQTTDQGRAGTNRPDLQLTIVHAESNGRRIYIEYDRSPPTRALDHARRIIANDPDAIVILKIIDFERPRR